MRMKIQILQRQIESRRIKHVAPPENVYVPLKEAISKRMYCSLQPLLSGGHVSFEGVYILTH